MTRTVDGDLLPWERPQAELEEYEDSTGCRWAGCTACGSTFNVTSGRELASWWRAHLYAHMRGVIA